MATIPESELNEQAVDEWVTMGNGEQVRLGGMPGIAETGRGDGMIITLRNDFHNTSVNIRANALPHVIPPSQERRIRRALCGVKGCACGKVRGPQHGPDGQRIVVQRDWYGEGVGPDGYPLLSIREDPA